MAASIPFFLISSKIGANSSRVFSIFSRFSPHTHTHFHPERDRREKHRWDVGAEQQQQQQQSTWYCLRNIMPLKPIVSKKNDFKNTTTFLNRIPSSHHAIIGSVLTPGIWIGFQRLHLVLDLKTVDDAPEGCGDHVPPGSTVKSSPKVTHLETNKKTNQNSWVL